MHVFVFRRLFLWREKEAELRDESPSYICPGSLLLDAAEYLPITLGALMKIQVCLYSYVILNLNKSLYVTIPIKSFFLSSEKFFFFLIIIIIILDPSTPLYETFAEGIRWWR
jgi:hypothetical protein